MVEPFNEKETTVASNLLSQAADLAIKSVAQAADIAAKSVAQAAESAAKLIASSAESATRVVSNAAAESVKVVNLKDAGDHDLLIELKTRMEGLKEAIERFKSDTSIDIKDLKDNSSGKIADHEIRIINLEKSRGNLTLLISIGIGILSVLVGLLIFHLVK